MYKAAAKAAFFIPKNKSERMYPRKHEYCDHFFFICNDITSISIHAAHEGCDFNEFYRDVAAIISIHAARVGSDTWMALAVIALVDFNPRCSGKGRYIL